MIPWFLSRDEMMTHKGLSLALNNCYNLCNISNFCEYLGVDGRAWISRLVGSS